MDSPAKRSARTAAALRLLQDVQPDVVLLQEVHFPFQGPSTADILARDLGMFVAADGRFSKEDKGSFSGLAILTRYGTGSSFRVNFPVPENPILKRGTPAPSPRRGALAVELQDPRWGGLCGSYVATTHLTWGAGAGWVRLREVYTLDAFCAGLLDEPPGVLNPGSLGKTVVLGGDFNDTPESDALRWLRGEKSGETGTFWIDTYSHCNSDKGYTSVPSKGWAARVANKNGLQAESVPPRRIDFILVRGWVYGKPGSPTQCLVVGDTPQKPCGVFPSDHWAVLAQLQD